jgi:ketosteroid isomerase-like protein
MAEENARVVRLIYDRLNRGDVDGVIALCGEEFTMDMSERVFNPDSYLGHDGIRRFYEGVIDAWESYVWNVEGTRVAGDMVVALLHCEGQSRDGGPGVDWRVAWVWTIQDGRAVAARFYRDRAKALKAAGLPE